MFFHFTGKTARQISHLTPQMRVIPKPGAQNPVFVAAIEDRNSAAVAPSPACMEAGSRIRSRAGTKVACEVLNF